MLMYAVRSTPVFNGLVTFERTTVIRLFRGDPVIDLGERATGNNLILDPHDFRVKEETTLFAKVLTANGVGWLVAVDISDAP